MLLEIREKVQGVFASIILALICVLFALWGIQNYLGGGKEAPLISVGDKDFFQDDVNQAYQQYAQSLGGMKFDEETLRKQALNKLVRDEVLLQYVQHEKLLASDDTAKEFIKTLDYFKKDGKFDKAQYQSLLAAQGMSSDEFVNRIKKAILMEQFQRSITDSSFVTASEVAGFFKIQNQKRDIEFLSVPLVPVTSTPSDEEINNYYQQHQEAFQSEEKVSIDYVELSLDKLAAEINPTEDQLKAYYEEQKGLFASKERRRISHILFAFSKDPAADQQALQKAQAAKQALQSKDFAALAAEQSDDKLTASKGGDLGLFNVGVMEKAFEDAAESLKLGEVSEPVKSAFGYHLIKVTELIPGEEKSYEAIKPELLKHYQKAQAESLFTAKGEKLSEISFENPDNLNAAAKLLGVEISKTGFFTRDKGDGVAADEKVRLAAFSEEVLKGNNSEPLEIGNDKLVVLRMQAHQPAALKELKEVKAEVIAAIQRSLALQNTINTAEQIKAGLLAGKSFKELADAQHLSSKKVDGVSRTSTDLPATVVLAAFKAPKPRPGQPSVILIDEPEGGKIVAEIVKIHEGEMTDADKLKQVLINKNIAAAFGKTQFEAVLNALQSKAEITMHPPKP